MILFVSCSSSRFPFPEDEPLTFSGEIMKKIQIALSLVLILSACVFSAVAQTANSGSNLHVDIIEFESSKLYRLGESNKDQFFAELQRGISAGESTIVAKRAVDVLAGSQAEVGSHNNLVVSDRKSHNYTTDYKQDLFVVAPQLLGGETDATSNLVAAGLFYERAAALKQFTGQGLQMIDLTSVHSSVSAQLDNVLIATGGAKNVRGTYTYLAVRFSRL